MTPKAVRKAPAAARAADRASTEARTTRGVYAARLAGNVPMGTPAATPRPPSIVAPTPVSARVTPAFVPPPDRTVRSIAGVCCNDCGDVYPVSTRPIPNGMVRLGSGFLVCDSCAKNRANIARPTPQGIAIDWQAAAQFTIDALGWNRRKLTDGAVTTSDAATQPPIARNDWAGLSRAVDAGVLTDAQAVELAQSWRAGVRS